MADTYIVKPFVGKVKKQNYFIAGKNVLLESGKEVDESIYNLFTKNAREALFELKKQKKSEGK